MKSLPVYGFCFIFSAGIVLLLSLSTEYIVSYVNDILVPCQHDSVWVEDTCVCDNTNGVYGGLYCENCMCKHSGICTVSSKNKSSTSRWACKCPSYQKWVGTLCDNCYAEENTAENCRGDCISSDEFPRFAHYGTRCDTVCMPDSSSMAGRCLEVQSGGGTCNACNGHGKCIESGKCQCDDGWFTARGGEQCAMSCEEANIPCKHGTCRSIGGQLQCICNPNWYGPKCEDTCGNPFDLDFKPCSGHGKCEYNSRNELNCVCDIFHRGTNCELTCPGNQNIGDTCSGHGICIVEKNVNDEDSAICQCQEGWAGFDCSCSPKYTCSGHGRCLYETSKCSCFDRIEPSDSHWTGPTCSECQDNWQGENCHLYCKDSDPYVSDLRTNGKKIGCNGHGSCNIVTKDNIEHITCVCDNTDPDTFCATCVPNYYPKIDLPFMTVNPCSVECDETICSYHGKCNENYDGTNDLCICDTLVKNNVTLDTLDPKKYCSTCKKNWYPSALDSEERCSYYCADDGRIIEESGHEIIVFDVEGQTSPSYDLLGDTNAQKICVKKAAEFWGPDAEFSADPDCRVCSGGGTCQSTGKCLCDGGHTGAFCEIDCGVIEINGVKTTCSNHGRCVRNDLELWFNPGTKSFRCDCKPYDTYTSETRQRLLKNNFQLEPPPIPEYYGEHCGYHCPRYNEKICTGRGSCTTRIAVDDYGQVQTCWEDSTCTDTTDPPTSRFCARKSTPWDSLMVDETGKHTGMSFFGANAGTAGYYTCAANENCYNSILSVEWDQFCVNMLDGWYPKELNTAQCTYSDNKCQEAVEDFFVNTYKDDKTWCKKVEEELTPSLKCSKTAYADKQKYDEETTVLCNQYTMEYSCNKEKDCIYDQNLEYIKEIDAKCANIDMETDVESCNGECEPGDNNNCITKTYCRAKHCEDIIYENSIENLCFGIQTPEQCPFGNWTDRCSMIMGELNDYKIKNKYPSEVFFSCEMYKNRNLPLAMERTIPGNIDIFGTSELMNDKNVMISQLRRAFISSRFEFEESDCKNDLHAIDYSIDNFCPNHLNSIAPSWYSPELAKASVAYMVYCNGVVDSLWSKWYLADNKIQALQMQNCKIKFNGKVENQTQVEDDILDAWTLRCLGKEDIILPNYQIDMYPPEYWTTCEFIPHQQILQWSHKPMEDIEAVQKIHRQCENGLKPSAPWVTAPSKTPDLCSLGACHPDDTCYSCSNLDIPCDDNADVFCESKFSTECKYNRCQHGGNCYQGSLELSSGYMCDYSENRTIGDMKVNGITTEATMSSRGLITLKNIEFSNLTVFNISWGTNEKSISNWFATPPKEISFYVGKDNNNYTKDLPAKELTDKTTACDKLTSSYNWFEYCDKQPDGEKLSTSVGPGIDNSWVKTGNIYGYGEKIVTMTHPSIIKSPSTGPTIIQWKNDQGARLVCGDDILEIYPNKIAIWDKTSVKLNDSTVIEVTQIPTYNTTTNATNTVLSKVFKVNITDYYYQVEVDCRLQIETLNGPIILTRLDLDDIGQLETFETNVNAIEKRSISNIEDISFEDEILRFESSNKPIRDKSSCEINVDGSTDCKNSNLASKGIRWELSEDEAIRISGVTKILRTENEVADIKISNSENTPIVHMYIKQHMLYLNGENTNCEINKLNQWWKWSVDIEYYAGNETFLLHDFKDTTVIAHTWLIKGNLEGCTFKSSNHMLSSTVEKKHEESIAASFHDIEKLTSSHCRKTCLKHEECVQWSHTSWDDHCYLYKTRCHEDDECYEGTHTLHAFHPHKIKFLDIYNLAAGSVSWWANLYAAPLLPVPSEIKNTCGNMPFELLSERWHESFNDNYEVYKQDINNMCRGLKHYWKLLPEYSSQHVGSYDHHDLTFCANNLNHYLPTSKPETCNENIWAQYQGMNWTSYCLYRKSFDLKDTTIDFMGGPMYRFNSTVPIDMDTMCVRTFEIMEQDKQICPVPLKWYQNCLTQTSIYEKHCSRDCVQHINDIVATNDGDPGLCERRKTFLDMKTDGHGNLTNVGSHCNDCDLSNVILTDFCVLHNAYHRGQHIRLPELHNSECDSACFQTLELELNRTQWRNWCEDLAFKRIVGVCSKTVCNCDTEEYLGVAGSRCELTCPTGPDDGKELACSGRNGECFAKEPAELTPDQRQFTSSLVEYRNRTDFLPAWEKGPEPNMQGVCQCQLGSGIACSIPCYNCNNGTYGNILASQYGICDSFNGICRSLAPFMRYNTKMISENYISYNTTGFVSQNGRSKWTSPEMFLYEHDSNVLNQILYYIWDNTGEAYGSQQYQNAVTLNETLNSLDTLRIFQDVCWEWGKTYDYQFNYLSNDDKTTYIGFEFDLAPPTKKMTMQMASFKTSGINRCIEIPISDWSLCFDNGEFTAFTDIISGSVEQTIELYVHRNDDVVLPKEGVSFSRSSVNSVYMFGGKTYYNSGDRLFNKVYHVTFDKIDWEPDTSSLDLKSVIFLNVEEVITIGDPPPEQTNAHSWAFSTELFVLSQASCMYTLKFPTPSKIISEWTKGDCVSINNIRHIYGGNSEIYIYADKRWTFSQNKWIEDGPPIPLNPFETNKVTKSLSPSTFTCTLEVGFNYVNIGNRQIALFTPQDETSRHIIRVYAEDLATLTSKSRTDASVRIRNAVKWQVADQQLMDRVPTTQELLSAFLKLRRVYMHQARWNFPEIMWAFHEASTNYNNDLVEMIVPEQYSNVKTDILDSLANVNKDSLFGETILYEPERIYVSTVNTPILQRKVALYAKYDAAYDKYRQKIFFGNFIMDIEVTWNDKSLKITMKRADKAGYITWSVGKLVQTWAMSIHVEEWRSNPDMDSFTSSQTKKRGWQAVFDLYTIAEKMPSYKLETRLNRFLEYTPSHCKTTSSGICPKTLPYINLPCSGRGRCNIGCQCVCEAAQSLIEADEDVLTTNNIENSPWRGEGCELTCPGYDGYDHETICNNRGTCQRDGTCMCRQGFRGDACQFTCPKGPNGQDCSGKGACGTTAYEGVSYIASMDAYKNNIIEKNAKNFQNAMQSFYGHKDCQKENYIPIQGTFSHIAEPYDEYSDKYIENAIKNCEDIKQNLAYKEYPSGNCIGLTKLSVSNSTEEKYYVPMVLKNIITTTKYFKTIEKFTCKLEDCKIGRNEQDDHSIANIKHTVDGTRFIFEMRYIHGYSTGRVIYDVNGKTIIFSFVWNENTWSISVNDQVVFEKSGAFVKAYISIARELINIELYPDIQPIVDNSEESYLSPDFMRNYIHVRQEDKNWYYNPISEDTGDAEPLPFWKNASYRCDLDKDCSGILRWKEPKQDGSLFALITSSASHYIDSRTAITAEYYTYEKMSKIYKGRVPGQTLCTTIEAGQSKYPFTSYTEIYNTPLQTVNIELAQDADIFEQTSDIVVPVGSGIWKYCWEKVELDPLYTSATKNGYPACCKKEDPTACYCTAPLDKCGIQTQPILCNKLGCYLYAKDNNRFGFAWSDESNTCLVYNKINSGKDIKLDKWNTDVGKTDFNPCSDSQKTIWFT